MEELLGIEAGAALGGGLAARVTRRRLRRLAKESATEIGLIDPNGIVSPDFRKWRGGRAWLSSGRIEFRVYPLWRRRSHPSLVIPVEELGPSSGRPSVGAFRSMVPCSFLAVETGAGTVELAVPAKLEMWVRRTVAAPAGLLSDA